MTRFTRYKRSHVPSTEWQNFKKSKEEVVEKISSEILKETNKKSRESNPNTNKHKSKIRKPCKSKLRKKKDTERRKIRRNSKHTCFACRQSGHRITECPTQETIKNEICYRCGSSKHTTKKCQVKSISSLEEFPYATCFVCKEKGHLSRDCPQNSKGCYPYGGICNICRSEGHQAKDCPIKPQDSISGQSKRRTTETGDSIDFENQRPRTIIKKNIPKHKLVRF